MAKEKIEVNDKGIRNRLKAIKPFNAMSEYIWNGFDAKASQVCIDYEVDTLGVVTEITISDDGSGINCTELNRKFKPFLSSEKRIDSENSLMSLVHGKNGLGRLTFFKFARKAIWYTTYKEKNKYYSSEITVSDESLDNFSNTEIIESKVKCCGTSVGFYNVFDISGFYMESTLEPFLEREFSWFLYLTKNKDFSLSMNGKDISYSNLIKDSDTAKFSLEGVEFTIEYVRWSCKLNNQASRMYFLTPNGDFKYSITTLLNNKSDSFHHSVYVHSSFFENFVVSKESNQNDFFSNDTNSELFKELVKKINSFLRIKRKPFLIEFSKELVSSYEAKGIFPEYNQRNRWEIMKAEDLREAVQQLYQIEPKFFKSLNKPQQKILVRMLSFIIDGGEVDSLFDIVDGVISLSSEERDRFAEQLKVTHLSSILKTIELITDRYKSVQEFKKLVFDPSMYAGEVPHLQKMMEKNYWLLGEQYQVLTAEEPDFNEALRRHTYLLRGEKLSESVDHEFANREMDLFMVRQRYDNNTIEHIVVELKHPTNVRLGKKQIDQIYDYYQAIKSIDQFNASNMKWKFYLIGNKFDGSHYIEDLIGNFKGKGDYGLAHKGEYEIYVRTWSEVFADFDLKHNFLNEKLNVEKEKIQVDIYSSADDIVANTRSSDGAPQLIVPSS
ncbi:ATP-binding protein [Serratia marcescens]|uniref:ATP-binding protein n=1 Tax=Serratia TaxID=613 RepID=UPI0024A78343|nr:ATP-binding protein [Serratia marcescens]MDM1779371.1 ATP-binding protein [Serratia marcescens]HED2503133.1 ATP-binding protein [Serratia marcescens]HEM7582681.1 ATP-binding protein [Serratia marcescens]